MDVIPIGQWFTTFLILWPINTVPAIMVTHNHKIISLLLHNCIFYFMNHNVNVLYAGYLMYDHCEKVDCDPQVENSWAITTWLWEPEIPGWKRRDCKSPGELGCVIVGSLPSSSNLQDSKTFSCSLWGTLRSTNDFFVLIFWMCH